MRGLPVVSSAIGMDQEKRDDQMVAAAPSIAAVGKLFILLSFWPFVCHVR
jgi:hypothetical protein